LIAKYIAAQLKKSFINIKISDVLRGEIGRGEEILRDIFIDARKLAPSIIFIDEFQSLFTQRDNAKSSNSASLTSCLLGCIDDITQWNSLVDPKSLITVMAATNEPWAVDNGFLRNGRFDKIVYVGSLNALGRYQMIKHEFSKLELPQTLLHEDILQMANATVGYSGADLSMLCQRICRFILEDYIQQYPDNNITLNFSEYLTRSLQIVHPSCLPSIESEYSVWANENKRLAS
jgi:SpoVK/Ycf46/Vps4 family AAA+-type ATPase